MNKANREFLKSAFAKDLCKKMPLNILASMSISSSKSSPSSSTKNTKTFLPKVTKTLQNQPQEGKEEVAPIILVDLKENEMNKYFFSKETQNSNKFLFFKSIHSNRSSSNQVFYYSNDFSDYYKEDLKKFSKKFKLIKSRIPIRGSKLRNAIAISKNNSKVLQSPVLKQIFDVTDKEVNHVNCSNDATSLVLKILNQINPVMEEDLIQQIKAKKFYYRTNKPLGNSEESHIDYTVNRRYGHSAEIHSLMKQAKEKENGLSLSTYNSNDKDLQVFDKAEKKLGKNNNSNNNDDVDETEDKRESLFPTSIFINSSSNKEAFEYFSKNKSRSILSTHPLPDKAFKRTNSAIIKRSSFNNRQQEHQTKLLTNKK